MFVGGSQAILRVQELIDKAARSGSTVLIIGESGVGKDVSSNEIHARSKRSGRFLSGKIGACFSHLPECYRSARQYWEFLGGVVAGEIEEKFSSGKTGVCGIAREKKDRVAESDRTSPRDSSSRCSASQSIYYLRV